MASPQLENGYTRIANELLEEITKYTFPSASPLKIMLFCVRKIYGYQKPGDFISLTQVEKNCNLSRPTVVHWLEWLVKSLLLVKGVKLSKNGYYYKINKNYNEWKGVVKPLKLVKARPFTSKTPLTVTSKTPLTHKRKKENTKESIADKSAEWNSPKYINSMLEDNKRHIRIIGKYFIASKKEFPSLKAARDEIKRWAKEASILAEYEDDQITSAYNYVVKEFPEVWNLSTIKKYINK